jgi:hypothetical protein
MKPLITNFLRPPAISSHFPRNILLTATLLQSVHQLQWNTNFNNAYNCFGHRNLYVTFALKLVQQMMNWMVETFTHILREWHFDCLLSLNSFLNEMLIRYWNWPNFFTGLFTWFCLAFGLRDTKIQFSLRLRQAQFPSWRLSPWWHTPQEIR